MNFFPCGTLTNKPKFQIYKVLGLINKIHLLRRWKEFFKFLKYTSNTAVFLIIRMHGIDVDTVWSRQSYERQCYIPVLSHESFDGKAVFGIPSDLSLAYSARPAPPLPPQLQSFPQLLLAIIIFFRQLFWKVLKINPYWQKNENNHFLKLVTTEWLQRLL